MPRKRFRLELKQEHIYLGDRTLVFALVKLPRLEEANERFRDLDALAGQALRDLEHGADIIDVSSMSLDPAFFPVSAEVEARSVVPFVKRLRRENVPWICVTTCHAAVAEEALQAGATFINDPSGLKLDPDLAPAVSRHDGALIVTHMRETPPAWGQLGPLHDATTEALVVLRANVNRALRAGVPRTRILVDPGLGLGKRKEDNSQILGHFERLREIEYPIVMTFAGKQFLGDPASGTEAAAELAAASFALQAGAHGVRGPRPADYRAIANLIDPLLKMRGVAREGNPRRQGQHGKPHGQAPVHPLVDEAGKTGRKGKLPPLRRDRDR